jgi:hypothetical protein
MTRQRDTHQRARGIAGNGRLSRAQGIRLDLRLANEELELALKATDVKSIREHVTLARRLVQQVAKKVERLK